MNTFTPEERFALWKQGFALWPSMFHFCTPAWREKYDALTSAQTAERDKIIENPRAIDDNAPMMPQFFAAMNDAMRVLTDTSEIRQHVQKIRNEIINALQNERVIALGYSIPRHPDDPPRIIPIDLWTGKVDWEKSEIKGGALQFISVRITRPQMVKTIENVSIPALPPPKKKGRPSQKAAILEAYDALQNQNLIKQGIPMSHYYAPIRNYLTANYPDRAGQYNEMSDETIRQAITGLFRKKI